MSNLSFFPSKNLPDALMHPRLMREEGMPHPHHRPHPVRISCFTIQTLLCP